jgi:hypothetical protein
MKRFAVFLFQYFLAIGVMSADWPQASGPDHNFQVKGEAPKAFSVSKNQNVLWRVPLPSTGQGTPIVSRGRVFITSHEPLLKDTETGSDILGLCFDAKTGKELWRRKIPGTRTTDLSSLFNDNTAASPVADGKRVVFTNIGGTIRCFDYDGTELWSQIWTPFGRHHARAHEPILHDGNVILMHAPCYDLPPSATTKSGSHPLGRGKKYWTYLQAYDLSTGKQIWQAESASSVHSTSILGQLANGSPAILTGRGGGHQPPEEPYGLSLLNAKNGRRIWDAAIQKYPAAQNANWDSRSAHFFIGKEHHSLNIETGKLVKVVSLVKGVTLTRWENGQYVTRKNQMLPGARKPITYFTNLIVGDYHYFRSFAGFLIGRVQFSTGKVEYLQVPVQALRKQDAKGELHWKKTLPNDMKNADGYRATQDKRNAGDGWGHVSAASPIVVGNRMYIPTMVGTVYVINWRSKVLDQSALVSVSDLGPQGQTWTLSSLSYSASRLYARTLKELICIEEQKQ